MKATKHTETYVTVTLTLEEAQQLTKEGINQKHKLLIHIADALRDNDQPLPESWEPLNASSKVEVGDVVRLKKYATQNKVICLPEAFENTYTVTDVTTGGALIDITGLSYRSWDKMRFERLVK